MFMIKLILKKFKKTSNFDNLDGQYWIQRIILNKKII